MRLSLKPFQSSSPESSSTQAGSLPQAADRGSTRAAPFCGLDTCANTLLTRSFNGRTGISVGKVRYCGVDCFAEAARGRIAILSGASVIEMRRRPRLSVGLILLSQGLLTEDQLRSAMSESQQRGEAAETILTRLGTVSERQVVAARATQWGCPVLSRDHQAQHVESDLPPTLLNRCSAVPLHYSSTSRRILLGFVHRVEHSLLSSSEAMTGLRTEPCFITPTEFEEQAKRVSAAPGGEEVVFEEPQTLAQMSNNVGGFASEVSAKEAGFARCRDYIWTRIVGKKSRIDLLFRIDPAALAGKPASPAIPAQALRSLG